MPAEVSSVLLRLSKNKQFEQLHGLLKGIYETECGESEEGAQRMKEHLKLILVSLGEQ